ncbi:uncharacterized protein LAESUDRAFT_363229 [Laetiporus sulphureus 93-53]|uniref:Uncharacterized protein n=1 Tax=Laetiporus sulphureus 93-53 TaxID=1314785 RepID=A0A165GZY3_9APHY|nr:uncharacterized protein LAESUDRAFT_363229 [Laetiporus sulphureus 93-53]KZT11058.1 hypothetical protein LAESUDRAFT_363229 [Laetiporus sulphureus 93-53]
MCHKSTGISITNYIMIVNDHQIVLSPSSLLYPATSHGILILSLILYRTILPHEWPEFGQAYCQKVDTIAIRWLLSTLSCEIGRLSGPLSLLGCGASLECAHCIRLRH